MLAVYIIRTIILVVIFFFIASLIKVNIISSGKGEVSKVNVDNSITYIKTVNDNNIYNQTGNLLFYVILFIGLIIILLSHGIEPNTVLTILGSIGLALALSMQTILSNVIYGIKLSFNKTIKIGDTISIALPNMNQSVYKGKVTDISLFNVKIATDKTEEQIVIPNNIFSTGITTNYSVIYKD